MLTCSLLKIILSLSCHIYNFQRSKHTRVLPFDFIDSKTFLKCIEPTTLSIGLKTNDYYHNYCQTFDATKPTTPPPTITTTTTTTTTTKQKQQNKQATPPSRKQQQQQQKTKNKTNKTTKTKQNKTPNKQTNKQTKQNNNKRTNKKPNLFHCDKPTE